MSPSGGRSSNAHRERRLAGACSLLIGMVLLALIVVRGQQAAREGNQELRNDAYWVLVSPLAFSVFGLSLLRRSAPRPVDAQQRSGQVPPALQRSLGTALEQAERGQRQVVTASVTLERQLESARQQLSAAQAQVVVREEELRRAAAQAEARITDLEDQLERMRQARQRAEADLQSLLDRSDAAAPAGLEEAMLLRQRLDGLTQDLEQALQAAQRDQATALAAQQAALAPLQQRLQRSSAEAERLQQQATTAISRLQERVDGMGSRLAQLEAEREQLQSSLENLRREDSAGAALAAVQATRGDLDQLRDQGALLQQQLQQQLELLAQHQGEQLRVARQQLVAALEQLEQTRGTQLQAQQAAGQKLVELDQQIQEAQQAGQRGSQALRQALGRLDQARQHLDQGLGSTRDQLEQAAGELRAQVDRASADAASALRLSREAYEQLERVHWQAGPPGEHGLSGQDPLLRGYREACEEIGVVPGSDWTVIRAAWRRNLKQWHPDQGGDARRWMRRNAAYQLLSAWYDFNGDS